MERKIDINEVAVRYCSVCDMLIERGTVPSKYRFCKVLGLQECNYNLVAKGVRLVSLSRCIDLCNVFGVDVTWLMTGEGEPWQR